MFHSIESLKASGFQGFRTIKEIRRDYSIVPKQRGVYMILYKSKRKPTFLKKGTGGFFKGKNPNVPIATLNKNWVKVALVLYIGKAGAKSQNATLFTRLRNYMKFGQGKRVPKWGGRYIWQVKNSAALLACWKPAPNPRMLEQKLIQEFTELFDARPFANLQG